MAAAEGVWLEIVLPLDPSTALWATPPSFEGAWDGFRLLAFLCKQIFMLWYLLWHDFWSSEGDAGTFFTVNILCAVLLEHCSCLSCFGGTLSKRCSLINVVKSESSANCSQGVCPGPDQGIEACKHAGTHQTQSRRIVREEGSTAQTALGLCAVKTALWNIQIIPLPKKADDVSSCQTGKFWEKWRNPGGKSVLCCSCQGKAAQGMRVTSQGMLCASGNPLLKDFQLIEKVKHPYSCWKRGCTTFTGHFSYKGNCS